MTESAVQIGKVLLIVLIFWNSRVSAQGPENEWQPAIVVASIQQNFLYKDISNQVHIAVPGVDCADLSVRVEGAVLKGDGCYYHIRPESSANVLWVYVEWKSEGEDRSEKVAFRIKPFPLASICFAGVCDDRDTIPVINARAAVGIISRIAEFDIQLHLQILKYRCRIVRECNVIYEGISNSPKFPVEMKDAIELVSSGDEILFDKAIVKYPDQSQREVHSLRLIVQ